MAYRGSDHRAVRPAGQIGGVATSAAPRARKPHLGSAKPQRPAIDPLRARHLALAERQVATELGRVSVTVDEAESPLAWLARRRGRDGRPLIATEQFQAGERLRADFTRAHLMPRTTSNWSQPVADGRRGAGSAAEFTEATVAARASVHQALDAVGPELSGLLLDVCCFLKGLEDVERERAWPHRSAKIVLQLALDRLARHYGYAREIRGPARTPVRTWLADDAAFKVDGS
jgi:hypothetical protein